MGLDTSAESRSPKCLFLDCRNHTRSPRCIKQAPLDLQVHLNTSGRVPLVKIMISLVIWTIWKKLFRHFRFGVWTKPKVNVQKYCKIYFRVICLSLSLYQIHSVLSLYCIIMLCMSVTQKLIANSEAFTNSAKKLNVQTTSEWTTLVEEYFTFDHP